MISADSDQFSYAFDPTNLNKRETSSRVLDALERVPSILALQTLSEFYSVSTRKAFIPIAICEQIVNRYLQTLHVVAADSSDLKSAIRIQQ